MKFMVIAKHFYIGHGLNLRKTKIKVETDLKGMCHPFSLHMIFVLKQNKYSLVCTTFMFGSRRKSLQGQFNRKHRNYHYNK